MHLTQHITTGIMRRNGMTKERRGETLYAGPRPGGSFEFLPLHEIGIADLRAIEKYILEKRAKRKAKSQQP